MLTGNEFVKKIKQDNQALFTASQLNVKAYFDSKPSRSPWQVCDHSVIRQGISNRLVLG